MRKILFISAPGAGMGLGFLQQTAVAAPLQLITTVTVGNEHPTEAKYDRIMSKYATGIKAAFAEKDDKKTIAMINKLNDELVVEVEKIKPELESWVKGLTEKDKEEMEQRMANKTYLKTIFEVMFDPEVGKRIEQNPELKKAVELGNKRFESFSAGEEDSEEEID